MPSYFTGQHLSPLVSIMRDNGYETTSIYNNFQFGHTKGPYIDNYAVNKESGAICALLDEDVRKWGLLGLLQESYLLSWASGQSHTSEVIFW